MKYNTMLRPFFKIMCLLCSSVDQLIGMVVKLEDFSRCHKVLVTTKMHLLILQIRIRLFFLSILVWVSTICYLKPTVLFPFSSNPHRTKNMTRIKILQTKREKEKVF